MEENLFHCIPQQEKTSSVVSHSGGKSPPLWDTMEENQWRCGIQCGRLFCIASHNSSVLHLLQRKSYSPLWDTVQKKLLWVGYSTPHKLLLWCRIQREKNSCVVGTMEKNLLAIQRLFFIVSRNGKKPLPLCPTMEENLLRCIPKRKKLFLCIPQRKKPLPLYPTMAKNLKLK